MTGVDADRGPLGVDWGENPAGQKAGLKLPSPWEGAVARNGAAEAPAPAQAPEVGALVLNPAGGNAPPAAERQAQRKIVYNATLQLIVADLSQAEETLRQIVKEHKGYIAQADLLGSTGQPRQGHWRLRVPADSLQPCVEALLKLGVPQKNSTDSRDVTEEYIDLEARLNNKKKEEATLQGYLADKKAMSKLEDILKIEQELSRVRGEIEQAEGRLRLLSNLSTLATLDVTMHEVKDYVPPQAPTFGNRISGTFSGSVELLQHFGEALTLIAVALTPWLPVLAVAVVPAWLLLRRLRARREELAPVVPVQPAPAPPAG
jgi:hypothetical protein